MRHPVCRQQKHFPGRVCWPDFGMDQQLRAESSYVQFWGATSMSGFGAPRPSRTDRDGRLIAPMKQFTRNVTLIFDVERLGA